MKSSIKKVAIPTIQVAGVGAFVATLDAHPVGGLIFIALIIVITSRPARETLTTFLGAQRETPEESESSPKKPSKKRNPQLTRK